VIAKVMHGKDTRGLLDYLYGPGTANEHTDPHLVAAWRTLAVPDPGRSPAPAADLAVLARRLDRFVRARGRHHVWHCAVRVAPTDRPLADAEWARIARRLADAAGVAPAGDARACRWVAVRHDGHESHHIHLLATLARQDDANPDIHNDALRLRAACRELEEELGLRPTSASDRTSAPAPTRGETEKALRRGWERPTRTVLEEEARRAAAAARTEAGFFALLAGRGVLLRRRGANPVVGYALALDHDRLDDGEPVWFSGASLAPDLSLPRVRARFAGAPAAPDPGVAAAPWPSLATALEGVATAWPRLADGRRAEAAAALSDAFTAAVLAAPVLWRPPVASAARQWSHAGRPPLATVATEVAAPVREAARALCAAPERAAADTDGCLTALTALGRTAEQVTSWYAARTWGPQERAARAARTLLGEVVE
jgi:8-oxo-dGTP pyrophosphatase MutT (NUDIX family)